MARNGIEKASGTLRSRYQALLLFVRTQDQEEVIRDADQFWIDQQGEQLLDQAQDTIMEFDSQLIADHNIQTSLLPHLQKDVTTATGSLAVTDSPRSISDVPSQGNQDSPHQTRPLTPSQGIVPPLSQPIQLRRVELPTFDGDITQYHDFWKGITIICSARLQPDEVTDHPRQEVVIIPIVHVLPREARHVATEEAPLTIRAIRDRRPVPVPVHPDDLMTQVHLRVVEDLIGGNVHNIIRFASDLHLMTVEALAVDHQTKTSPTVILLLDTGAQRSFISQYAVTRLNIKVSHINSFTTVTFGAVRTAEPSGMVNVDLVDNQGRKIRLILRTKEHLTVPCSPINFTAEDRQFLQSHNIRLESLTISRAVTPDILIGIDYFWDIVTSDCPQTLPSGLLLCNTRFGPTISGSKFFVAYLQQFSTNSTSPSPDEADPVSRFDHLDVIGIADDPHPSFDQEEDSRILRELQDTTVEIDGHLYVQFPWKSSHPRLANNKLLALKRLKSQ
nr:gag protein [Haemonchus contortus]